MPYTCNSMNSPAKPSKSPEIISGFLVVFYLYICVYIVFSLLYFTLCCSLFSPFVITSVVFVPERRLVYTFRNLTPLLHLPCSQYLPENPCTQVQLNVDIWFTHFPPFWHVTFAQSVMNINFDLLASLDIRKKMGKWVLFLSWRWPCYDH